MAPGVYTGVPGGIPTNYNTILDVTQSPYNADNTGATDAHSAVQTAVNAAGGSSVIYLPAGTYRFDSEVGLNPFSPSFGSYKIIRGAGTNTIVKAYGTAAAFNITTSADHSYQPSIITNGFTKGSSNIVVADAPWYPVNTLVVIKIPNSTNVFTDYGFSNVRQQETLITHISGNTLTIWPPLYEDSSNAVIEFSQFEVFNSGVEDMVIDMTNSTAVFPVQFGQTIGCWMKGVTVKNANNYCAYVYESLNFEMRKSVIGPSPANRPNHSGLLMQTVSGALIEDNIFTNDFPLTEFSFGMAGSAFGYNYMTKGVMNINHGPENFYSLYEGNIGPHFQSDGYFGGSMYDTLYRNWFTGNDDGVKSFVGSPNRFTRYMSLVGNVFGCSDFTFFDDGVSPGNPNINNSDSIGTQSGNTWQDWDTNRQTLRTAVGLFTNMFIDAGGSYTNAGLILVTNQSEYNWITSAIPHHISGQFGGPANFFSLAPTTNHCLAFSNASSAISANGFFTINPSPSGFQEKDLDVAATLIQFGNYNFAIHGIPAGQSMGANVLSNSLYRVSKPDFFGTNTWPVDFTTPTKIPAQVRFETGFDGGATPNPSTVVFFPAWK